VNTKTVDLAGIKRKKMFLSR